MDEILVKLSKDRLLTIIRLARFYKEQCKKLYERPYAGRKVYDDICAAEDIEDVAQDSILKICDQESLFMESINDPSIEYKRP